MARIHIEVGLVDFQEGGNTIWVQSEDGTVLRIKCSGKIVVKEKCINSCAHADINVKGDIEMCLPGEREET